MVTAYKSMHHFPAHLKQFISTVENGAFSHHCQGSKHMPFNKDSLSNNNLQLPKYRSYTAQKLLKEFPSMCFN